jgi:outer membrane phospholipase A
VRHESNGQQGRPESRSLNIAYIRPAFSFGRLDGWNLLLLPRIYDYIVDRGTTQTSRITGAMWSCWSSSAAMIAARSR